MPFLPPPLPQPGEALDVLQSVASLGMPPSTSPAEWASLEDMRLALAVNAAYAYMLQVYIYVCVCGLDVLRWGGTVLV